MVPTRSPPEHVPEVPVTARVSCAGATPLFTDHCSWIDWRDEVLFHPLHIVGSSSCRENTSVMMSPFSTFPAVPPLLLAIVTDSGNMTGVVAEAAPSCLVLSVNDAAEPTPATAAKTAVTVAIT